MAQQGAGEFLAALGLILPQAFSQRYGQIAIKDEIAYGLAAAAILRFRPRSVPAG